MSRGLGKTQTAIIEALEEAGKYRESRPPCGLPKSLTVKTLAARVYGLPDDQEWRVSEAQIVAVRRALRRMEEDGLVVRSNGWDSASSRFSLWCRPVTGREARAAAGYYKRHGSPNSADAIAYWLEQSLEVERGVAGRA